MSTPPGAMAGSDCRVWQEGEGEGEEEGEDIFESEAEEIWREAKVGMASKLSWSGYGELQRDGRTDFPWRWKESEAKGSGKFDDEGRDSDNGGGVSEYRGGGVSKVSERREEHDKVEGVMVEVTLVRKEECGVG